MAKKREWVPICLSPAFTGWYLCKKQRYNSEEGRLEKWDEALFFQKQKGWKHEISLVIAYWPVRYSTKEAVCFDVRLTKAM